MSLPPSSLPAEIQAQVDKLEKQKQQKIQQLETKAASLQKTLERQQEQLRTGELRSTRPVNRTLQSIQNVANQIPQTTANFDRQISFAKQQQTLAQQEQQRVQQAFASLDERFGPRQQTTLPRSVQKLANPIDARIRQLQKNIRVQGDIVKKFEIQKQINSLSIQRETLLRKEAQRFQQAFETERQFKLATSRQQARAEGIKQSEVRAIAASQGVAVGTIGTSQAGNQIANIVTPKGETKEVVLPKAIVDTSGVVTKSVAEQLQETPIEKLPEPTAAGGRALNVELAETLSLTDKATTEKINQLGGIDLNLNLAETLKFSDVKKPDTTPPTAKERFEEAFAESAAAQPIAEEDIAGKDFQLDLATGQLSETVRLTEEAKKRQQKPSDVAAGQLFFQTPTDLALGLPTQIQPEKITTEIRVAAGEQPILTPEQKEGPVSIVQAGVGGVPSLSATQPITAFLGQIENRIGSFIKQQEQVAELSTNPVTRGLASLNVGIGKLVELGFSTSPVGIALKTGSLIEQAEKEKVPKKFLEQAQDDLFNTISVQKQIAEKSPNPVERGLANLTAGAAGIGEQLASDVAFGINILTGLQQEARRVSIRDGEFDLAKALEPKENDIFVSETLANVAAGKGIEGIFKSSGFITSGDPLGVLQSSFGPAGAAIAKNIEERGLAAGIGSIAGILLPFNPKAVVPLRAGVGNLGQKGLIKTLELGVPLTKGQRKITLATQLGTDPSKSLVRNLFAREGDVVLGGPLGKRNIEKLSKQLQTAGSEEALAGTRGIQLSTLEGLGLEIARDPRIQQQLVRQGQASAIDIAFFNKSDELAQKVKQTIDEGIGEQLQTLEEVTKGQEPIVTSVLPSRFVEQGLAGESKTVAQFLKEFSGDIGGGLAQKFVSLQKFPTGDIDLPFQKAIREAQRAAGEGTKLQTKLSEAAKLELPEQLKLDPLFEPREFKISLAQRGPKVFAKGGPQEQIAKNFEEDAKEGFAKVAEVLTKKDVPIGTTGSSSGQKTEVVFGVKDALKGRIKVQLPFGVGATKVESVQTAIFKNLASTVSLQKVGVTDATPVGSKIDFLKGTKTKTSEDILPSTKEGFSIRPPDFRLKEFARLLGEGQLVDSLAFVTAKKNPKLAAEIQQLRQDLRELVPVDIDLDKFAREAAADVTDIVPPTPSAASQAASSIGGVVKDVPFTPIQAGKTLVNTKDIGDSIAGKKEGELVVFHTTSPSKAKEIINNPKTFFKEDEIFFTALTKSDAERLAANKGATLKITLNKNIKHIGDESKFGTEQTFGRFPTRRSLGKNEINFDPDEVVFNSGSVIKKIERASPQDAKITKRDQINNFKQVSGVSEELNIQAVNNRFAKVVTDNPALETSATLRKVIDDTNFSVAGIDKKQIFQQIADNFDLKPSSTKLLTGSKKPPTTSKSLAKALDSLDTVSIKPSVSTPVAKDLQGFAGPTIKDSYLNSVTSKTSKQPSKAITSSSLLRGLDSLGSLSGSVSTKSPTGLPSTSSLTSLGPSPPSPPSITGPSVTPPSLSPPPSKKPPSTRGPPSIARPSLVFGKSSVLLKPPLLRVPPLIKIPPSKDDRLTKKLPIYATQLRYVADPADPLRVGVFAAAGVGQLVSGKADIFKTIDKQLAKARQSSKAVVPLGERIGIERARIGQGPRKKSNRKSKSKSKKRKR